MTGPQSPVTNKFGLKLPPPPDLASIRTFAQLLCITPAQARRLNLELSHAFDSTIRGAEPLYLEIARFILLTVSIAKNPNELLYLSLNAGYKIRTLQYLLSELITKPPASPKDPMFG